MCAWYTVFPAVLYMYVRCKVLVAVHVSGVQGSFGCSGLCGVRCLEFTAVSGAK
jgi:hypothetical protein